MSKIWQCIRCEHVVLHDERPVLRWDDGHSCIFYEQPDPVTTFREINNEFYDGDHPIEGISTALDTSGPACTLIIYENGETLAAISEQSNGKIFVLFTNGDLLKFTVRDKGEIVSEVQKRSTVFADIRA